MNVLPIEDQSSLVGKRSCRRCLLTMAWTAKPMTVTTNIQAKNRCQRRAIDNHWLPGSVSQDGNPRASSSPSWFLDAPRKPVVMNSWPNMLVTPTSSPSTLSLLCITSKGGAPEYEDLPQYSA